MTERDATPDDLDLVVDIRCGGFAADPIDLPDGPSLYPMWREPR